MNWKKGAKTGMMIGLLYSFISFFVTLKNLLPGRDLSLLLFFMFNHIFTLSFLYYLLECVIIWSLLGIPVGYLYGKLKTETT